MSYPHRPGFTWVELVVVVLILGMLVALLPSFLINSRSPGRRASCMNNQKQLSLGMLAYESSHRQFPGYVNRIGKDSSGNDILAGDIVAGWVVPLFPHLEHRNLWERWHTGTASDDTDGDGDPDAHVFIRMLICPSDPPAQETADSTPLSYVVNCGRPGDSDTVADGVFFNHDVDSQPLRISLDYIAQHDGASSTLLLSENIQAGRWTDTTEANLGMVWRKSPGPGSMINQGKDAGDRPQDVKYARPSSHHRGIVVATFCDGHVVFLDDEIDYRVYQHLMTPHGGAAGLPGKLDEDDF